MSKHPLLGERVLSYIFDLEDKIVEAKKEENNLVVITNSKESITMHWKEAELFYVDWLKANSKQAEIQETKANNVWKVKINKERNYTVKIVRSNITCTCYEFKMQEEHYKHQCCSHVYAILNLLGHNSLKEFIQKETNQKILPFNQLKREYQVPKVDSAYDLVAAEADLARAS